MHQISGGQHSMYCDIPYLKHLLELLEAVHGIHGVQAGQHGPARLPVGPEGLCIHLERLHLLDQLALEADLALAYKALVALLHASDNG